MNTAHIKQRTSKLRALQTRGESFVSALKEYLTELGDFPLEAETTSSFKTRFFGVEILVRIEMKIGAHKGKVSAYRLSDEKEPKLIQINSYGFDSLGNIYKGDEPDAFTNLPHDVTPPFVAEMIQNLGDVTLTP